MMQFYFSNLLLLAYLPPKRALEATSLIVNSRSTANQVTYSDISLSYAKQVSQGVSHRENVADFAHRSFPFRYSPTYRRRTADSPTVCFTSHTLAKSQCLDFPFTISSSTSASCRAKLRTTLKGRLPLGLETPTQR